MTKANLSEVLYEIVDDEGHVLATALLYFTRGWLLAKKADLSHLLVIAPTEFMLGDSELAPILQAMSDSANLSFMLYDHTGKTVMTLLDENQEISKILIFQNPDKTPFEEVNKITSIIRMKDPDREGFFRWDSGYTYIKIEGNTDDERVWSLCKQLIGMEFYWKEFTNLEGFRKDRPITRLLLPVEYLGKAEIKRKPPEEVDVATEKIGGGID